MIAWILWLNLFASMLGLACPIAAIWLIGWCEYDSRRRRRRLDAELAEMNAKAYAAIEDLRVRYCQDTRPSEQPH
jgi:hypothetical protein